MMDHRETIADAEKMTTTGEEEEAFQSPHQKKFCKDAHLGKLKQGRNMRGNSLSVRKAEIEVRTVVKFALHSVDVPNNIDGLNLTCVVVMKVKGEGYLEAPKYLLTCSAGTLDCLYNSRINGSWQGTWVLDVPTSHQGERRAAVGINCRKTQQGIRKQWTSKLQLQRQLFNEQVLLFQAWIVVQFELSWWSQPQLHKSQDQVKCVLVLMSVM
jgi:hypothetical protein